MEPTLETKLREALTKMTYPSLSIPGVRRQMMEHHIDSIIETVMPIVAPLEDKAWMYEELKH